MTFYSEKNICDDICSAYTHLSLNTKARVIELCIYFAKRNTQQKFVLFLPSIGYFRVVLILSVSFIYARLSTEFSGQPYDVSNEHTHLNTKRITTVIIQSSRFICFESEVCVYAMVR